MGSGKLVRVSEAGEQAGVVSVKGTLAISGGSLEVSNGLEASTVASLTINGGELTGVATIDISGSLYWSGRYGQMSGLGKTVVESGASATLKENVMTLKGGRTLVNEGTTSLEVAEIYMSEGAVLENKGTFFENSEYGSPQINVEQAEPPRRSSTRAPLRRRKEPETGTSRCHS